MLDPITYLTSQGIDVKSLSLPNERLIVTIQRLKLLDFITISNDQTNKFYDWIAENKIEIDFYLNAVLNDRYECVVFTNNITKLEDIIMLFKLSAN